MHWYMSYLYLEATSWVLIIDAKLFSTCLFERRFLKLNFIEYKLNWNVHFNLCEMDFLCGGLFHIIKNYFTKLEKLIDEFLWQSVWMCQNITSYVIWDILYHYIIDWRKLKNLWRHLHDMDGWNKCEIEIMSLRYNLSRTVYILCHLLN
jgi:hypothetical protein